MNFDKKVIYLSYVENGIKAGSAGYIKIEVRDNLFSMDMHINVKRPEEGTFEIAAESGERMALLGVVHLQDGVGSFREKFPVNEIGKKAAGMAYDEIVNFKILLGEGEYIIGNTGTSGAKTAGRGVTEGRKTEPAEVKASQESRYGAGQLRGEPERPYDAQVQERPYDARIQEGPYSGQLQEGLYGESFSGGRHEDTLPLRHGEAKEAGAGRYNVNLTQDENVRKDLEEVRQTPDKWRQLLKSYKQVHPYGDERIYVSIEPKDFVVMSGEYQHLAHNSFLLHGFYNYRHIIMGEENGSYYLGVPGVFYDREKMVAMMFGFEAFECEGGKAENGKFGYYLKKVKI